MRIFHPGGIAAFVESGFFCGNPDPNSYAITRRDQAAFRFVLFPAFANRFRLLPTYPDVTYSISQLIKIVRRVGCGEAARVRAQDRPRSRPLWRRRGLVSKVQTAAPRETHFQGLHPDGNGALPRTSPGLDPGVQGNGKNKAFHRRRIGYILGRREIVRREMKGPS